MTDFYEAVRENARQAIKDLPAEDFDLILNGIQHDDETVRRNLITDLYYPAFENTFRKDRDKQQQILDLLKQRYTEETPAVRVAILNLFTSYFSRNSPKDESFRPIQTQSLHDDNAAVIKQVLEWAIFFYADDLKPRLLDLMTTHPDPMVRGQARILALTEYPDDNTLFDAESVGYMLINGKSYWENLVKRHLRHFQTEEDALLLMTLLDTPRLSGITRNAMVAQLRNMTLDPNSEAFRAFNERFSPFAELGQMLQTPVDNDLLHPETWQKAVTSISEGKAKFYDVGWHLYAKLAKRDRIQPLYDEVMAQADPAHHATIQQSYTLLMQQINHYERM